MDDELRQRLDAMEAQLVVVQKMTKKMYYFFLTMVIASIIAFVLPLILLMFEIPTFISTYQTIGSLTN